jgi:hypothetical protein
MSSSRNGFFKFKLFKFKITVKDPGNRCSSRQGNENLFAHFTTFLGNFNLIFKLL